MNILKHIKALLYRYDTVIIPGFGALQGVYASATLDKKNNLIFPPHKKLSYNEKLTFNDGKLSKRISEAEGISEESANEIIKKDVAALFNRLNLDQIVTLDGIGTIRKNERGVYELMQDTSVNYLLEAYGLKSVALPKKVATLSGTASTSTSTLKESSSESKSSAETEATASTNSTVEKSEVQSAVTEERIITEDDEGSGWWAWLLVPIVLIGLGFLFWKFIFSDKKEDIAVKDTVVENISPAIVEDTLKTIVDSTHLTTGTSSAESGTSDNQSTEKTAGESSSQTASQNSGQTTGSTGTKNASDTYTPPPRPASPEGAEAKRGYYMVISSTQNKSLARKKTQDLISRGLQAGTIPGPKGYWRSGIFLSEDQTAAKQRLNELKGAFPDGWLLNH